MVNQIPLDPKLPKNFDDTDNRVRSKAQLDAWWDHPFGVTRNDGRIDVRCLNGGAWDRSTSLGQAENYNQACVIASEKQAQWVRIRSTPTVYRKDEDSIYVVVMEQRPDQGITTLAGPFKTTAEVTNWFEVNVINNCTAITDN